MSEKIPGAPSWRCGEWKWLTGSSGLHRNSVFIRVFWLDQRSGNPSFFTFTNLILFSFVVIHFFSRTAAWREWDFQNNVMLCTLFSLVSFLKKKKTYKMGSRCVCVCVYVCVCVSVCVCVCVCVCLCTILVPPYQFPNQLSDWYKILATYTIVPELSNAINPVS